MKAATKRRTPHAALPSLHNGDHMTQEEFHRRYTPYPDEIRFELIGGVVYKAGRVPMGHATSHAKLSCVLELYATYTPGVEGAISPTVLLGKRSEPHPDVLLRILPEYDGQAHCNTDDFLVGAPELVGEIAHSSRAIEMHRKRLDYQAAGVREYLVFCVEEQELHWFHFPSGRKYKPDRNGVWKSRVFPGLWIDGPALAAQDTSRLIAAVQQGLATPEHAAFVRRLEVARK